MTLAALFALQPAPIDSRFVRLVTPLGPQTEGPTLTRAQLEQRRAARLKQIGHTKAPNGQGIKR